MGIVYHAHYLVWFEIGRTEWCRAAGIPYAEMERAGLFIPVTRVEASFRRRSSYDDAIRIDSRMAELSGRGCAFAYEVRGEGGELAGGRVDPPRLHGSLGAAPPRSGRDSRAARTVPVRRRVDAALPHAAKSDS